MHLGHPCPKPCGRQSRANRLSCRFVLLPGRNDRLPTNALPHNEDCWIAGRCGRRLDGGGQVPRQCQRKTRSLPALRNPAVDLEAARCRQGPAGHREGCPVPAADHRPENGGKADGPLRRGSLAPAALAFMREHGVLKDIYNRIARSATKR